MKMKVMRQKLIIHIVFLVITSVIAIKKQRQCAISPLTPTTTLEPLCKSEIYCAGEVLHTIQMAEIFPDSKTFVDMKLKRPANVTIKRFHAFMKQHNNKPSKDDVGRFVSQNFDKKGTEIIKSNPVDWKASPKFLNNIKDPKLRFFGSELNKLWRTFGNKMKPEVEKNSELYSIIYVENLIIAPGGRFGEFYYWDTYWIILGLLHSQMYATAKGMLLNFFSVIDRYGFVPNGGRIYYLTRSQPPLLTSMVQAYIDATGDTEMICIAINRLNVEFEFFEKNRMQEVNGHRLAAYGSSLLSNEPRPESYREDYAIGQQHFSTQLGRGQFYGEIIAAAESGNDFSTRWFIKNGTNQGELYDIHTKYIIPVELNAILYFNAKTIANFYRELGKTSHAVKYEKRARQLFNAVQAVLWNEEKGIWLDFDVMNGKPRPYFVPNLFTPLFFGCFDKSNSAAIANKVLNYINSTGVDDLPGGLPASLVDSGQQWDFPNAWAPQQHWAAEGLRKLNDRKATALANKWTQRWTLNNFVVFNRTGFMYEKYSAKNFGTVGGGGEYDVQTGFGWTNGVIIDYLAKYGHILTADEQ